MSRPSVLQVMFLFRLFLWFSARQLRTQPWRVAAVLLGIGLGAAVFTSVRLAVDASLDAFTRSMDLFAGRAGWTVITRGGRVPERLVARLLLDPDVETASPLLTRYVQAAGEGNEPFLLIGLDPLLDSPLRNWEPAPGASSDAEAWLDLIRRPDTLLITRRLAGTHALSSGDTVKLEHVNRSRVFHVLGVLKPGGIAGIEGGYTALADISTVQEFTGLQGWVDRIDIRLFPGAGAGALKRIKALLPPETELVPASEAKATGSGLIRAYQLNLSLLSFVSLFVGMFLIYSLVSFNAASRRRETAILRSLGASARQVFMLVLFEGALLGALGWIVAIPLGSLLTGHLIRGVSNTVNTLFVRVRTAGFELDAAEIVVSFLVTMLVSVLAAFRPARRSVRVSPREALTAEVISAAPQSRRFRGWMAGFSLIAVAYPLSRLPAVSGIPLAGYGSLLAVIIGFSMLTPALLHLIGEYLPSPLRRRFGEPAFLAARYVRDAGDRTAISIGALITAVALFVALVIMVDSFRNTVSLWVHQTVVGDLFVRPKMAGLNRYRDPLPQAVVRDFQALSQDVELLPYRRLFLSNGKVPYQLDASRVEVLLRRGHFLFLRGDRMRVSGPLISGKGVIVSEVFANQTGLGAGNEFRADVGAARIDLPILGVFRDYRTQGGVVVMSLDAFQRITGDTAWGGAIFFFKDRERDTEAAAARLQARILQGPGAEHPLEMATGGTLRREVLQIFDETFAVTTVLLIIALIVAGLGMATTLTVLVIERMRQLNTLMAVGASVGQIRSMIVWEALFMVTAGEGVGLLCGFFLSYLLIYVINLQSFGWTFLYRVDWGALLPALPLILGTALAAALPACRLVLKSSPALVLREH